MRRQNFWSFMKGILFIQLFLLAIIAGLTVDLNAGLIKTYAKVQPANLLILFPALQIDNGQGEALLQETSLLLTGGDSLMSQLGITELLPQNMAENMIGSQIQVLAYTGPDDAAIEDETEPEPEPEGLAVNEMKEKNTNSPEAVDAEMFKGQAIYLYCTHSAESYVPDSGQARLDGKRGLINTVAASMGQELQKQGLQAHFINVIHDYPDYNTSYTRSRVTVKKIIQSNDDILALFDVHRDSIPNTKQAPTIEIQGKKSAQILIVVGTNERKPHPNWKKNYDFAQRLYAQSEKTYPGLIKGVRTKAGTYNQEFHPHALLLEFGSDYNTLEEATYAAHLFTNVLIQVLKEEVRQL